jgi:hypothetical protein
MTHSFFSRSSAWRVTRRTVHGFAALGLLGVAAMTSALGPGCSKFCETGFARNVKGKQTCEGLCSPAKCQNPGNVCVNNLCALQCASQSDCPSGQECVPVKTDGPSGVASGAATSVCVPSPKAPIGAPCPNGTECGSLPPACPDGSNCDYSQCGGDNCAPDPIACSDVPAGTVCTVGKCQSDGTPCVVPGCTQDQCQPLVCLFAGQDDAAAYCSLADCHQDTDCPAGYWCPSVRDAHPICGGKAPSVPGLCSSACSNTAGCTGLYGDGATCNTTTTLCVLPCVTPGADNTYAQGSFCTQHNECRLRRACDPCQSDLDCSIAGQHCTAMPMGSDKFCTADCASDADCADGFQCTGNACVPRYGSCQGTGNFCEPCHTDADCGAGMFCGRDPSGVERFCRSPLGLMKCTSDAQCPVAPSGLHGKCMDQTSNSNPGDGVYHTCAPHYIAATARFGCWLGNPTSACDVDGDCTSKMCVGANPTMGLHGVCQ